MGASPLRGLWGPALRVLLYGAGLLVLGDVILHRLPQPAHPLDLFGEYGRLEWVQVGLLVVSLGLSILTAVQCPQSRPLSILLVGCLAAVLVREHNNYFKDNHFSGLWQLIVAAVFGVTLLVAWRWRRNFLPALRTLVACPAFGWLCSAVLLVGFAQLLDEESLWAFVLEGQDIPYAARRVGEETVELAAFYLFAVGLVEYRLTLGTSD